VIAGVPMDCEKKPGYKEGIFIGYYYLWYKKSRTVITFSAGLNYLFLSSKGKFKIGKLFPVI
jgi:hypothetical protein